jgi:rhodanese-related sulfurtransferase
MKEIIPEELKSCMDAGNIPALLDVRETWEYEICHIDNSFNISMSQIPSRITELNPDQEIVLICHHGMRSLQVANYLESQGYTNISNLVGGIDAWARTVDPSMAQY